MDELAAVTAGAAAGACATTLSARHRPVRISRTGRSQKYVVSGFSRTCFSRTRSQTSIGHSNTGLYYRRGWRKYEVSRLAPRRRHRVPGRHDCRSLRRGQPLIDAVKKQDVQAVRTLLKQKLDINATEADGFTALHWAAQRNDLQLVDLLLGAGANARTSTRYNITPLYLAAVNGNAAIMERLLKAGADPNATAQEGQTMLMTAALSGKADAVRLLLTRSATVDTKEPYRGQTALMWAAAEGNTAAVDVLLEAGADLTLKSNGGFTPLLFAVRNAHIEAADDAAEARRERQRGRTGRLERAEHRDCERLLRAGIGAARSRREPEPARPAWVAAPYRGVAAQTRRRRRRRRR